MATKLEKAKELRDLADKLIKAGYDSDSATDWDRVRKLQEMAVELEKTEADHANDEIGEIVKGLALLMDYPVTWGYIGNLERWGDDRDFRIFAPHPDRIGKSHDCYCAGSYLNLTDFLAKLKTEDGLEQVKKFIRDHKAEESKPWHLKWQA
jgi:hypothetical protein